MLSDSYHPRIINEPAPSSESPDMSPLKVDVGLISGVSGSSYMEIGGAKVMCSIHGPHASQRKGMFSKMGQLECDVRYASSAVCPGKIQPCMITHALQSNVHLEKYAKTIISINIVVLQSDGNDLAPAITCASLALLNAGIEMRDIVCAFAVASRGGKLLQFPSAHVAKSSDSFLVVASVPRTGEVTQLWLEGKQDTAAIERMVQICCLGNVELRKDIRQKLLS